MIAVLMAVVAGGLVLERLDAMQPYVDEARRRRAEDKEAAGE